jgi:hypothetical protein
MRGLVENRLVQVLALVALVFTVYANTLWNNFHYDDSHSLLENPHIRTLANIPRFFKDPTLFSREPAMAMYRPVVLVIYALNYALGQYRPLGYHMLNILLHAAGVVLVYLFLVKWQENSLYAWWGSALWGLHPIHTQVVNYISARAEVLAAIGVLASLLLLLKKNGRWYCRYMRWVYSPNPPP